MLMRRRLCESGDITITDVLELIATTTPGRRRRHGESEWVM